MQRIAIFLFLCLFVPATAGAAGLQRVDVYEYGTYAAYPAVEYGQSRQGIPIDHATMGPHLQTTRTIVARLNVSFGFKFRAEGTPSGALVPLRMVAKFPAPGVLGHDPNKPIIDDDYQDLVAVNGEGRMIFTFDHDSDLVPGTWTFEVWSGDRKLAEQSFNVILPPVS